MPLYTCPTKVLLEQVAGFDDRQGGGTPLQKVWGGGGPGPPPQQGAKRLNNFFVLFFPYSWLEFFHIDNRLGGGGGPGMYDGPVVKHWGEVGCINR